MADDLINLFLQRAAGEVYVAYTDFTTTLRQKPKVEKFLNVECSKKDSIDYIIEPNTERVLEELLAYFS